MSTCVDGLEVEEADTGVVLKFSKPLGLHKKVQMPPGQPLRVLVVDDCQDSADTLAIILRLWGFDALAAYGGEVALAVATTYRPDVALIDLGMPEMDGCQLAEHFRGAPELRGALREVLLIALTGYSDKATRLLCEKAGFVLHLTKPPDLAVLRGFLTLLARKKTKVTATTAVLFRDLPRIRLGSGRYFVQVPEGHPALDAVLAFGILAQCVQVGTSNGGRSKVYLYRGEDWELALANLVSFASSVKDQRFTKGTPQTKFLARAGSTGLDGVLPVGAADNPPSPAPPR